MRIRRKTYTRFNSSNILKKPNISLKMSAAIITVVCLSACQPPDKTADAGLQQSDTNTSARNISESQNAIEASNSVSSAWQYVQIDDSKKMWGDWAQPDWLRYFGLAAGDVNGDGLQDIVSGRYVYLQQNSAIQPLATQWERLDLGDNVDAILVMDADGDSKLDIIAQALPNLYWYELAQGNTFIKSEIGQVPATTHVNSQGFTLADITNDDREEFIIAGNGNLYAFSASLQADGEVQWQSQLIAANTSDEGIGAGDIDGDGDIDIAAGRRPEGEPEPKELYWYENPGHMNEPWKAHYVGQSTHPIDRVEIADLNANGKGDIVFTEERYPGLEPDAQLIVMMQTEDNGWTRNVLATQYSMNNLDIGDIDQDGDLDLVTAEHKGEALETELWLNDGKANFSVQIIDSGKESHLGTQMVDIDADGDLDLISAGWDQHQFVHLWLNPHIATVSVSEVSHLSRPHFRIDTPHATYLLDKKGGGFSSIIDTEANDWVNFKMQPWGDYPAAAAGAFRGIPNAVHAQDESGAGHPGFDQMQTSQIKPHTFLSTSNSGQWQWQYQILPTHVEMHVLSTPENASYWFLYEGTPGGAYEIENYAYGTDSLGHQKDAPDFYQGSIKEGQFSWAYFAHQAAKQSFFVAQVSPDEAPDVMSYLGNTEKGAQSEDGMVVFGFGRDKQGKPRLQGTHRFIFGLLDKDGFDSKNHEALATDIQMRLAGIRQELQ
uniref:FG-GAP repeat domain-containing protein n=1 Tax=Ningiella ruwaisensis TaxID=2364274 RepID=UPI00109FC0F4|nr:VCBS repeat-containing protein [Ningiella ruwaisensis]